jgi:long-chain fatty acid transport protein
MSAINYKRWPLLLIVTAGAALFATSSKASNFLLTEQSAVSLGQAHAGGAAFANNASTIFYNPAGLTRLTEPEFIVGFSGVHFDAEFTKQRAVDAIGEPLSGDDGGHLGKLSAIPIIYYAQPITDHLVAGIGFNVPYGLETDYHSGSVLRYQAIYSRIAILQANPSIAYKLTDHISLGAGIDVQYASVKLTNKIDAGAACFANAGPVTCTSLRLTPQSHDIFFEGTADDTAVGYNFGILFDYGATRVGLSYRTRVTHDFSGDAKFNNVPTLFSSMGLFTDTGISARFTTPQIASLSIYHDIDAQWSIMADFTRTGWSSFKELRVDFDNPRQPDAVQPEGLSNVNRYSLGVDYRYSDHWTFHGGIAYDKTPVPDPNAASKAKNGPSASRTARLPDADRKWIAAGVSWHASERSQLNLSYAHLFLSKDIPFDQVGASGDRVTGTFRTGVNLVSFSYRYRF